MEIIYFEKASVIKREKENLEKKLNVSISIQGKKITIEGSPIQEYETTRVMEAMTFGFSAKKALSLLNEEMIFRKLSIKNFTRRKNLYEVRARLIGSEGQTKKTIQEIARCSIIIKNNEVGIIGPTDSIDEATTALASLIRGSKQANVYHYLEKTNTSRKKYKIK
ncbi:MAG: hypothetical protein AABW65_00290 [Nanoarchaeota archaeon]